MFEEPNLVRYGCDEALDHILVGEKIRAFDRVPGMQFEAVALLGPHHRRRPALGADRVRAHQLHFGNQPDVEAALAPMAQLDGGAKPGQAGAENHNIMGANLLHFFISSFRGVGREWLPRVVPAYAPLGASRSATKVFTADSAIRTCCIESRSRTVTVPSFIVS